MRKTQQFAPVLVYKKGAGKSKSTVVATFLTRYRARKFILHRLAVEPQARNFQWHIGTPSEE